MRTALLVLATAATLSAASDSPHKVIFARVFPNAGQLAIFVANADGSGERRLLTGDAIDYDPVWAPDGASIVFTSDREGSGDLFRVKADGSALERLTDDPAYDDQAAFAPDGKQLVFVSSRQDGRSHLWTLDLATRQTKRLTGGASGGDFRPSWSPDGRWIAFSSDRDNTLPFAHGRWEGLQLVDLFVMRPDGSALKRISPHGHFCGSPKWTADSKRVLAYCMTDQQTLANRVAAPVAGSETRLVSFEITVASGEITVASGPSTRLRAVPSSSRDGFSRIAGDSGPETVIESGPGVKFQPVSVGSTIAYIRKDTAGANAAGIYYTDGRRGPIGDVRSASWSPDGARVVFRKRLTAPRQTLTKLWSRLPDYELKLSGNILPSFTKAGDRMVTTGRPAPGAVLGSSIVVGPTNVDATTVVYQDPTRNVLGPQWSPSGDRIVFGVGTFNGFFNGFHGLFLKPGDRAEGGAQVAIINADGSGFRELTKGTSNSAFPSFAPDGKRIVFRAFGTDDENGLRILNLETNSVTTLTKGYDNFPLWSPRGDLIMFSRLADGDYEIYTVKPDGSGLKRLSHLPGNDAHQGWSPDGSRIVFASSRMGFKDECTYTDAPQPYGEIFTMRADGSDLKQLTDTQWEEGTPAWQP